MGFCYQIKVFMELGSILIVMSCQSTFICTSFGIGVYTLENWFGADSESNEINFNYLIFRSEVLLSVAAPSTCKTGRNAAKHDEHSLVYDVSCYVHIGSKSKEDGLEEFCFKQLKQRK